MLDLLGLLGYVRVPEGGGVAKTYSRNTLFSHQSLPNHQENTLTHIFPNINFMKQKDTPEEKPERDTSINEDDSVTVTKEGSTIQVYQDPIYRGSIREKARKPGHWYISNIEATGNTAEEFKKNLKEAKKKQYDLF